MSEELIQNFTIPKGTFLDPSKNFPLRLMPEWIRELAEEHAEKFKSPVELWATAFLCGIASATGKSAKLYHHTYTNYPQLWLIVVGAPGAGKSDPFRVAFRKIREIEDSRLKQWRKEKNQWVNEGKKGAIPLLEQSLINDTTPEALFAVLEFANKGLTLLRDELSGWFQDFGRYNKSGEIGHYLSIFNNDGFRINRKSEEPRGIENPYLSIFGTIQPSVLQQVLSKNQAEESGFAQRFLFLYPTFGERDYVVGVDGSIDPEGIGRYETKIEELLAEKGETVYRLSAEADKLYGEFFLQMEKLRNQSCDYWAAVYSKAQIQVLRLALTVAIARDDDLCFLEDAEVEEDDMACAIGMQNFFIRTLKRLKEEAEDVKGGGSKKEAIEAVLRAVPDMPQSEIARIFKVSRQYVNEVKKG